MQIGELFVALGFDVDNEKLEQFGNDLRTARNGALVLTAAVTAAVYGINAFVQGSVKSSTALRNFSAETGESIQYIKKWQVAASLMNSSIDADEVLSSIQRIKDGITEAQMGGGGNAGAFAKLGVNVIGMNVEQAMEAVRKALPSAISKYGRAGAVNILKEAGFDPRMLQALEKGRGEFEKLARNRFLNGEQSEKLVRLGDAIRNVTQEMGYMKDVISADMADSLIMGIEKANNVFKNISVSIKAIGSAYGSLFETITSNKEVMTGLLAFFGSIEAVVSPVSAAISALVIALDDLGKFISGKDSYLGDLTNIISGALGRGDAFIPKQQSSNVTMNNNFSINSTAPAQEVANELGYVQNKFAAAHFGNSSR